MYFEGELPTVAYGNCNNGNNGWSDFSWIIGLALVGGLFGGWGNGGFGFGGGHGGYACGTPATQADLANGFAQNTLQRGIDDIILGQAQAINYNNQGFAGLNTAITSGFSGVDRAVCTLGYNSQAGFNAVANQLATCCCDVRSAIADVKYANERQTCDIIASQNAQTQRLLDFMVGEKLSAKDARIASLEAQISNDRQSAFIIDALAPKCPAPAYVVQPPQQVTFPTNCCGNVAYAGYGACGASVQ